jgi:hypothetical protein
LPRCATSVKRLRRRCTPRADFTRTESHIEDCNWCATVFVTTQDVIRTYQGLEAYSLPEGSRERIQRTILTSFVQRLTLVEWGPIRRAVAVSQVCGLNKASLRIGNIERTDIAGGVERSALQRELNTTLFPEAPPYVVVPRRLLLRDPDYGRKAWKLSKYLCRALSSNHNLHS